MQRPLSILALLASLLPLEARAQPAAPAAPPSWGDAERRDWVFQAPGRGEVRDIAWSGDGTRLGVASSSGTVSVIEAASGDVVATHRIFSTSYMETFSLALDEHGTHMHGWGNTGDAAQSFAWDVAADRVVMQERTPEDGLSYSPDGARGVYGGRRVCTYRMSSGRDIRCAAFEGTSPEVDWPVAGTIVAMGPRVTRAGTLRVLDALRLTERFHVDGALDWAMDARGRVLVVLLADAAVVLDVRTGAERRRIPVPAGPTAWLAIADDGSRLAIAREATSTIVSLAIGRAAPDADVVVPGLVMWLSRRRAVVAEAEGETRRYVLPAGTRGMRLQVPDANEIEWTRAGAAAGFRADRIEISDADGRVHAMSTAGEHSVWRASIGEGGSLLEIDGRFGLDAWTADGAFETECGRSTHFVGDRLVERETECTLPRGTVDYVQRLGGTTLYLSGRVTLASGEQVRLRDAYQECTTDETDLGISYSCDSELELVAGGAIVVNRRPGEYDGDAEPTRLFDARTGRALASFPDGYAVVVDPLGRWAAAGATGHLRVVRLSDGAVVLETGEEPEYHSEAWMFASEDGSRLVVRTRDPRRVHVVDPIAGREVAVVDVATSEEAVFSHDASAFAHVTGGALHVTDVATSRTIDTPGVTGRADRLMCEGARAFVLDAGPHALVRRDVGACEPPGAEITGGGRFFVWRSEGVVRLRRLSDGRELWLRSMRGEHVVHFAHDAAGHWWSDASGEVPMHRRSSPETEPQALDAAMRDPELLRRFFATR